jgi:hypothetical protein
MSEFRCQRPGSTSNETGAFAVSALSGIVPTPVQLAGAAITVAALVMNNLYQRQRVQRESASPYGHTAAANYLRRKPN